VRRFGEERHWEANQMLFETGPAGEVPLIHLIPAAERGQQFAHSVAVLHGYV
jgi:hypothetical protein